MHPKKRMWIALRVLRLFFLGILPCGAQRLLSALGAQRIALGASDDIDDDVAAIFAARRACTMRELEGPALAGTRPGSGEAMMAPALRRLGSIPTHSYYHSRGTIPSFPEKAKGPPVAGPSGRG